MRSILVEMSSEMQVIPSQGSHLLGFENLQAMFSHSNIGVVLNFFFQLSEERFVVFVIIKIASESPGDIGLYKTTSKGCSPGITKKPEVTIGSPIGNQNRDYLPMFGSKDEMVLFWNCAGS